MVPAGLYLERRDQETVTPPRKRVQVQRTTFKGLRLSDPLRVKVWVSNR